MYRSSIPSPSFVGVTEYRGQFDKRQELLISGSLQLKPIRSSMVRARGLAIMISPWKRRGLMSGLLQQGYSTGNLLAALCFFFVFDRVGWRFLFLLGGLPGLLSLFVYFRVKESEVWRETRHQSSNARRSRLPRFSRTYRIGADERKRWTRLWPRREGRFDGCANRPDRGAHP
jgi:MFS family permease